MMIYPLLTLCLLAALFVNAQQLERETIVGRVSVSKPVKYLVTINRDDKPACLGGIIGTWIILTAASCVYDKTTNDFIPGKLSIIAGYDNATVVADVEKIYVPKGEPSGDIAVLKLKQNLNLRENREILQRLASPRTLRGGVFKNYVNEKVKIATYDEDYNITLPYLLGVKVTDESQCVERWNRAVEETELCAKIEDEGYGPMKICDSDLGSPLVFRNKIVIGVAVVPPNRCVLNGEPTTYTRVSSFLSFIKTARTGKNNNVIVKVL